MIPAYKDGNRFYFRADTELRVGDRFGFGGATYEVFHVTRNINPFVQYIRADAEVVRP